MNKSILYKVKVMAFCAMTLLLSNCDLAGLEFQDDAPYDYHVLDPQTGVSAWEYMNRERPDSLFKYMLDAIAYAGLEDEYSRADMTFLLIQNQSIIRYNTNGTINTGSWFGAHLLVEAGDTAKTWDRYPVEVVREFLQYHILEGVYTFGQNLGPENVEVSTLLEGETATIRIGNERNSPIRINDFPFALRPTTAASSNIQTTNGVVHVINGFTEPGTTLDSD